MALVARLHHHGVAITTLSLMLPRCLSYYLTPLTSNISAMSKMVSIRLWDCVQYNIILSEP